MKVICMIPTYNHADFIEEVIKHYLSQGLELVILDDGSTDGTVDICKKYTNRKDVELFQVKHDDWGQIEIFRILYDMALLKSPDWVVKSDADELLESGIKNMNLKDAIIKVDSEGYNTIQFDWFEFFLTSNDDNSNSKIKDRMRYYSWQFDFLYRSWKISPGISPELGWGHVPVYPTHQKYKIYPKKFVARHYRFRTVNQAKQKLKDVKLRTKDSIESKLGLSKHYEKISNDVNSFIVDHSILSKYNEDNNWNLERKFFPYVNIIQPTRNEFFNKDGYLKKKIQDISELRLDRKQLIKENSELKIQLENIQKGK